MGEPVEMAVIDRVKWDGAPNTFAWKYPSESLTNGTQLIVNESQEAYVVSGGIYDGPFGPGRHTLENENIPLISELYALPYGGKAPFTAEVWYVNKAINLDIKWGTSDPIQLQDPRFGIMVPLRAFGQYGLHIVDSKRFLLKLVGTLTAFDQDNIADYVRGYLVPNIKNEIARVIIELNVSVLEVTMKLLEISQEMLVRLSSHVEEYGLAFKEFNVHSINVPEDDPAVITLKNALAKRAEMGIVGYNYQQERGFDVLQTAAGNEGVSGDVMGAGIGLGAGLGIGGQIGGAMGMVAGNMAGAMAPPVASIQETMTYQERLNFLKQLAELREQGVLNEAEFEAEKKKIMGL